MSIQDDIFDLSDALKDKAEGVVFERLMRVWNEEAHELEDTRDIRRLFGGIKHQLGTPDLAAKNIQVKVHIVPDIGWSHKWNEGLIWGLLLGASAAAAVVWVLQFVDN